MQPFSTVTTAASGFPINSSSSRVLPTPTSMEYPVILKANSALKPLYSILGVNELTPSLAVKSFTLPALTKVEISSLSQLLLYDTASYSKYQK